MTQIAWLPRGRRRALLRPILAAALGAAANTLVGGPASASGETGGSPTATGTSSCPSSNPPNQLTLAAGTPQTTTLDTTFLTSLQAALTNSNGCPVTSTAAGVPVTFTAPSNGPSGMFAVSASSTVTVGSNATGAVTAPAFTANDTQGSYALTAISSYGTVSFDLTNTAAGIPAKIVAAAPASLSATVASSYPQTLQVRVLDSSGNPVPGASVTFTLDSASTSRCGLSLNASASFIGAGAQATAATNASGVATSPLFTASSTAGSLTATAAISTSTAAGPGSSGSGSATPVSFALHNTAGDPAKLTVGAASPQSSPVDTRFPIRLAVTVIDAEKNPAPGALVTFTAPASGASGHFTTHARGSHHHRSRASHPDTVKVKTNACGIAIAPPFTANDRRGGYIVKASVKHARPAAFALVNTLPIQSP